MGESLSTAGGSLARRVPLVIMAAVVFPIRPCRCRAEEATCVPIADGGSVGSTGGGGPKPAVSHGTRENGDRRLSIVNEARDGKGQTPPRVSLSATRWLRCLRPATLTRRRSRDAPAARSAKS